MSQAKQASKRKRMRKAVPVAGLGLAGLSLSLVGGATTAIGGPAANMPTQTTAPSHEMTLGEEEISDVSLATFYVFDKENAGTLGPGTRLAMAACAGCAGCGGFSGCWDGTYYTDSVFGNGAKPQNKSGKPASKTKIKRKQAPKNP